MNRRDDNAGQDFFERLAVNPPQDFFERLSKSIFNPPPLLDPKAWHQKPTPPAVVEKRRIKKLFSVGCPTGIVRRDLPRRTFRKASWCHYGAGGHRPGCTPSAHEILVLLPARKVSQARCAAFVALAVWSDLPLATILRLHVDDLHQLTLPARAWVPIVRLIAYRRARGVQGTFLFCTFRFAQGIPINHRDFARYLIEHQIKRGITYPYTFTGMRNSKVLATERRITLREHIRTCQRLPQMA